MNRLWNGASRRTQAWLNAPLEQVAGVMGFRCWRFWAVLACYGLAFLALVRDPFFFSGGSFSYQQGLVTLCLAFVLVAAVSWELVLLGPVRGANLLLQFVLCLPAFLFIARITGAPSVPAVEDDWSLLGGFWQSMGRNWVADWSGWIPYWLRDLFANWRVTLFFLLVLLALSFRKLSIKMALLLLLLLIEVFAAVGESKTPTGWLLGGGLLLFCGIGLQFCRFDRMIYFENVAARLSSGPIDRLELRTVLQLARIGFEEGRVSDESVRRVVKSEYETLRDFSRLELKSIAADLTEKIIYQYRIMQLTGNQNGLYLVPDPRLCSCESLLGALSVWPRVVLVLAVTVLWVLMPFDLIPDALPFVGMLDDVTVTVLSMLVVKNAVEK